MKVAFIYRRCDASGNPVNSGLTLPLTITDASQLQRQVQYYPPAALIILNNSIQTVTYNGTIFNSTVLSDAHTVELDNDWIPSNMMKDLAYYMYQMLKTARDLYTIDAGCEPRFEFEPPDACSLTFSTTKIQKTGLGLLLNVSNKPDGSLQVGVLL
jgi:hypothetical protein